MLSSVDDCNLPNVFAPFSFLLHIFLLYFSVVHFLLVHVIAVIKVVIILTVAAVTSGFPTSGINNTIVFMCFIGPQWERCSVPAALGNKCSQDFRRTETHHYILYTHTHIFHAEIKYFSV